MTMRVLMEWTWARCYRKIKVAKLDETEQPSENGFQSLSKPKSSSDDDDN